MIRFFRSFLIAAVFSVVVFTLVSCVGEPDAKPSAAPEEIRQMAREPYSVADYKGKNRGEEIPEWVRLYLEAGIQGVETLEIYQNHYAFVSRGEGGNFRALNLWTEGFSPELDFPRLAAVRIEARFLSGTPLPDDTYGSFFEEIIRAASDASWGSVLKEDDFWILKKAGPGENENYEFFILVTMRKTDFTSRLNGLFRDLRPYPPPTSDQRAAADYVKERFFEGF